MPEPETTTACRACQGTGKSFAEIRFPESGASYQYAHACPVCHGSGFLSIADAERLNALLRMGREADELAERFRQAMATTFGPVTEERRRLFAEPFDAAIIEHVQRVIDRPPPAQE